MQPPLNDRRGNDEPVDPVEHPSLQLPLQPQSPCNPLNLNSRVCGPHYDTESMQILRTSAHMQEEAFPNQLQLHLWYGAFGKEFAQYRSSAIVNELFLERAKAACQGLKLPSVTATATALSIFGKFAPLLASYQGLALGIVDEVVNSIYVAPCRTRRLSNAAKAYTRATFFDAFFDVAKRYIVCRRRADALAFLAARRGNLLTRAVFNWKNHHVRSCFKSWKSLTEEHTTLRKKCQKLYRKAALTLAAKAAISTWRRLAHDAQLNKLATQNVSMTDEIAATKKQLVRLEHQQKALSIEIKRNEETLQSAKQLVTALRKSKELHCNSVARLRLLCRTICSAWGFTVVNLFDDIHLVPENGNIWLWLCEFLDSKPRSAEANQGSCAGTPRTGKVKLNATTILLVLKKLVSGQYEASETKPTSVSLQDLAENAERFRAVFDATLNHILMPIRTDEIVRGDQTKLRALVMLLMDVFAGGYCSCFFPNHCLLSGGTEFPDYVSNPVPSSVPFSTGFLGVTDVPFPKVQQMTDEWHVGMSVVAHARHIRSLSATLYKDTVQFGESESFQRSARRLFDTIRVFSSASDVGVSRTVVEGAVLKSVSIEEKALAMSIYPNEGISNITEFTQYVEDLAEITAQTSQRVMKLIDENLETSEAMNFLSSIRSEEAQLVVASYEVEVRQIMDSFATETNPGKQTALPLHKKSRKGVTTRKGLVHTAQLSKADFLNFSRTLRDARLHRLEDAELEELYGCVTSVVETRGEKALVALLCVLAMYHNPSPFVSLAAKLRAFFETLFHS